MQRFPDVWLVVMASSVLFLSSAHYKLQETVAGVECKIAIWMSQTDTNIAECLCTVCLSVYVCLCACMCM